MSRITEFLLYYDDMKTNFDILNTEQKTCISSVLKKLNFMCKQCNCQLTNEWNITTLVDEILSLHEPNQHSKMCNFKSILEKFIDDMVKFGKIREYQEIGIINIDEISTCNILPLQIKMDIIKLVDRVPRYCELNQYTVCTGIESSGPNVNSTTTGVTSNSGLPFWLVQPEKNGGLELSVSGIDNGYATLIPWSLTEVINKHHTCGIIVKNEYLHQKLNKIDLLVKPNIECIEDGNEIIYKHKHGMCSSCSLACNYAYSLINNIIENYNTDCRAYLDLQKSRKTPTQPVIFNDISTYPKKLKDILYTQCKIINTECRSERDYEYNYYNKCSHYNFMEWMPYDIVQRNYCYKIIHDNVATIDYKLCERCEMYLYKIYELLYDLIEVYNKFSNIESENIMDTALTCLLIWMDY